MATSDRPDDDPIETTAEEVAEGDTGAPAPGQEQVAGPTAGRPARRPGSLIRIAGYVLMGLGALLAALSGPAIFDPEGSQCTLSRTLIEDANDNDDDFDDVEVDGTALDEDAIDDLSCAEAVGLADDIPEDEDGDETKDVPSENAIRTQGIIASVIGVGQAVSGFAVARTLSRRARTFAVAFGAFGLVFPLLGLISLAAMAFVIYALLFSPDSRATWGTQAGLGGLFRPRPRPTDTGDTE